MCFCFSSVFWGSVIFAAPFHSRMVWCLCSILRYYWCGSPDTWNWSPAPPPALLSWVAVAHPDFTWSPGWAPLFFLCWKKGHFLYTNLSVCILHPCRQSHLHLRRDPLQLCHPRTWSCLWSQWVCNTYWQQEPNNWAEIGWELNVSWTAAKEKQRCMEDLFVLVHNKLLKKWNGDATDGLVVS